jgi:hypothetical protein
MKYGLTTDTLLTHHNRTKAGAAFLFGWREKVLLFETNVKRIEYSFVKENKSWKINLLLFH